MLAAHQARPEPGAALLTRSIPSDPGSGIPLPQPQADGTRNPCQDRWVFFDWSGGPVHVLHGGGQDPMEGDVVVYGGLDHLLDSLAVPTHIRCEATFESFNVDRRAAVLERCRRDGHDFKVVNPRATAKRRRLLAGPDTWKVEDKDDYIDVRVIRHLATDGVTHFTPVVLPQQDRVDMREQANTRLMHLRRTKHPRASKRARSGWAFDSAKDAYADELIELLPDPTTLTPEQQLALCTGSGKKVRYSKCVVAAVGVIAEFACNTRDFDYLAGLYQNGYPSQLRSDLVMHRWSKSVKGTLAFTDFRRELRWLFHTVRETATVARSDEAAEQPRSSNAAGLSRSRTTTCKGGTPA